MHCGFETPQSEMGNVQNQYKLFPAHCGAEMRTFIPRGFKILGRNLLTSYFAQTHQRRHLYPKLYEELHGLKESAKSMSCNCVLGGAVESDVMKIDWMVIAS